MIFFFQDFFVECQKTSIFAPHLSLRETKCLGLFYGVMAALGFLVPSVQVRILVEQPKPNILNGLVAQLVRATDS